MLGNVIQCMYECHSIPPGYNTKLRSVSSLICRSSAWGSAADPSIPSSIGFPCSFVLSTSEYGGGSENGCAPRRAGLKSSSQRGVEQGNLATMHRPYSGSILSKASWLEAAFSERNPNLLVVTRQVHEGSIHRCGLSWPAVGSPCSGWWMDDITSAIFDGFGTGGNRKRAERRGQGDTTTPNDSIARKPVQ